MNVETAYNEGCNAALLKFGGYVPKARGKVPDANLNERFVAGPAMPIGTTAALQKGISDPQMGPELNRESRDILEHHFHPKQKRFEIESDPTAWDPVHAGILPERGPVAKALRRSTGGPDEQNARYHWMRQMMANTPDTGFPVGGKGRR